MVNMISAPSHVMPTTMAPATHNLFHVFLRVRHDLDLICFQLKLH